MKIISGPLSMFGAKVEIAAHEKGIDFELIHTPFDPQRGYEPKHPDVLRINPKRQVPVLMDDGLEIFDSTQIFEYLEDVKPDPALWPADPKARAVARQLEHCADEIFFPNIIRLMSLENTPDDPAAQAARIEGARYYRRMEEVLGNRDCLAPTYSYADIAFYMAQLFGERKGVPMTEATPNLLAWRKRMSARPAVLKVAGAMADYLASIGSPVPAFLREAIRRRG
ncbi:glutathione S-transferase family protein [Paraburkholderia sp. D15]|uniref:glutathione S-transferase family protein n=1 Tax=Paraburkholderia sp. D15 TaxID=2880218 RepID=UPI002478C024|nr:glutathione S-transferase family protein [Paraburkholderia sp. D15]WGS53769.1 glutathione S-transferase family protein [Paraburkholderia sp. D15]